MSVGTELKRAREKASLSPEQISERTRIQLYEIDALENNTFELLPQGIYLDGIVRAYANEVTVDGDRMVELVRLERGKLPGDWGIPVAPPVDLRSPSTPRDGRLIDVPDDPDPLRLFATESAAPIARSTPTILLADHVLYAPNSPSASNASPLPYVPPRPARGHALLIWGVPALLAAATAWGAYTYESTHIQGTGVPAQTAAAATLTSTPISEAPVAAHTQQPTDAAVPSGDNAMSSDAERRSLLRISARSTRNVAPSPAPPIGRAEKAPATTAVPARRRSVGTSGSIADVSGSWTLATHVESSSHSGFAGLQLGYEMKLEQDGDRVTGLGRKISENGSGIDSRGQTPVTVSGTIAGDRLTLNFVENGAQRQTQGKFVLLVDEAGALRGRFSSNAAQSSGRVEAYRVSAH